MSAEADQLYLLPGVSQKYRKLIKCFTNKCLRLSKNFDGKNYKDGSVLLVNYFVATQTKFLPRVWWKGEPQDGHGGDEDAGHDEVEEVVEGPPPDLDGEGDVQVGGGAALVPHFVPLGWNTCKF